MQENNSSSVGGLNNWVWIIVSALFPDYEMGYNHIQINLMLGALRKIFLQIEIFATSYFCLLSVYASINLLNSQYWSMEHLHMCVEFTSTFWNGSIHFWVPWLKCNLFMSLLFYINLQLVLKRFLSSFCSFIDITLTKKLAKWVIIWPVDSVQSVIFTKSHTKTFE